VYAKPKEKALPYLRPYDVFDYLPVPADNLSVKGTRQIEALKLQHGSIVLPASGRNLGPAVAVDSYLAGFLLSHDAIRVLPNSTADGFYLLAFINSPTGQSLIRGNITGSVIDHIGAVDIAGLPVPLLPKDVREAVRALMAASVRTREKSRLTLHRLTEDLAHSLSFPPRRRSAEGWTVQARDLGSRIDAAPYHPTVRQSAVILQTSGGRPSGDIAQARKPASRYKAYHVNAEFGWPFLAGGQIRQARVIAPKHMAERVFKDPDWYRLKQGEVIFAADGRADEGLGLPVMVTPDRHGWLASEHVMRMRAKPGNHPGSLYLALTIPHVQQQIQALACGSVVDTLYEGDIDSIVLPQVADQAGEKAAQAWEDFATAQCLEHRAISLFEAALNDSSVVSNDVLVTVREAAAILSSEPEHVCRLINVGLLTSLGGSDAASALLALGEVLQASASGLKKDASRSGNGRVAYGYVASIAEEDFEAVVSDEPGGPGALVVLPRRLIASTDNERLRVGDSFTWHLPIPVQPDATALDRSQIRLVPRPILTSEEVNEAYRWADAFSRNHIRTRDRSVDDPN